MKRFSVLAATLFLLSFPLLSGQQSVPTYASFNAPPPAIVARVYANPAKYRGHCPARITFNGQIMAPPGVQSGAVGTFRFVRSDGHQGPVRKIFPGTSTPSTTWSVGGRSTHRFSGWVQIEILTPSPATSPKAEFTVECH